MQPYWTYEMQNGQHIWALHAFCLDVHGNRGSKQEVFRLCMQYVNTSIADGGLVELVPGNMFSDIGMVLDIDNNEEVRIRAEHEPGLWASLSNIERMRMEFQLYSAQTTPTGQEMH